MSITVKDVASMLKGIEYPLELSGETKKMLMCNGIVVVHGYSDDGMLIEGAIYDHFGCYNGATALIDEDGVLLDFDDYDTEEDLKEYFERKPNCKEIEAIWDEDGYSWQYKTDIPHECFVIMEDDEKYCKGIIFDIKDLK